MLFAYERNNGKACAVKIHEDRLNSNSEKEWKDKTIESWKLPPEHAKLPLDELIKLYPVPK